MHKVNCRQASIGVSIPRGIIAILNLSFLILKNNSIYEFNYQNELRRKIRVKSQEIGEKSIGERSRTLDFTFDANID